MLSLPPFPLQEPEQVLEKGVAFYLAPVGQMKYNQESTQAMESNLRMIACVVQRKQKQKVPKQKQKVPKQKQKPPDEKQNKKQSEMLRCRRKGCAIADVWSGVCVTRG